MQQSLQCSEGVLKSAFFDPSNLNMNCGGLYLFIDHFFETGREIEQKTFFNMERSLHALASRQ